MSEANTTLYLVDDHSLVRSSIKKFLESFDLFTVLGQAGDGEKAFREIIELKPDVVLMDITLPDTDGIELTQRLVKAIPDIKIIAVTMHQENVHLLSFLQAGGKGYIHKSSADQELIKAIRTICDGRLYLSDEGFQIAARSQSRQEGQGAYTEEKGAEVLSEREKQVLRMMAHGYSCREIGQELYLATSTVDTYKRRIKEKLELHTRVELVDYAIRNKII